MHSPIRARTKPTHLQKNNTRSMHHRKRHAFCEGTSPWPGCPDSLPHLLTTGRYKSPGRLQSCNILLSSYASCVCINAWALATATILVKYEACVQKVWSTVLQGGACALNKIPSPIPPSIWVGVQANTQIPTVITAFLFVAHRKRTQ